MLILFYLFTETASCYVTLPGLELSIRPGWHRILRDLLASASEALGLKACTVSSGCCLTLVTSGSESLLLTGPLASPNSFTILLTVNVILHPQSFQSHTQYQTLMVLDTLPSFLVLLCRPPNAGTLTFSETLGQAEILPSVLVALLGPSPPLPPTPPGRPASGTLSLLLSLEFSQFRFCGDQLWRGRA